MIAFFHLQWTWIFLFSVCTYLMTHVKQIGFETDDEGDMTIHPNPICFLELVQPHWWHLVAEKNNLLCLAILLFFFFFPLTEDLMALKCKTQLHFTNRSNEINPKRTIAAYTASVLVKVSRCWVSRQKAIFWVFTVRLNTTEGKWW